MRFSQSEVAAFSRIAEDSLPDVVPNGFTVVHSLDIKTEDNACIIRGSLSDGREIMWIKRQFDNEYLVTLGMQSPPAA